MSNEARAAKADLDRLLEITTIDVPDGYEDLSAFNEALVAHLTANPDLGFDTTSMSCHNGGTSGEIFDNPRGPTAALRDALERACSRYRERIAHLAHPWVRSTPRRLDLNGWCTVLRQGGYQHGHIHPTSWLSGVYYLRVPEREGGHDDHGGCIEFGRAPDHYPPGDQGEVRIVAPRPGTLVLFPSFVFHRTVAFTSDVQRVTVAFDFRPAG